jgi:hypothetical protein
MLRPWIRERERERERGSRGKKKEGRRETRRGGREKEYFKQRREGEGIRRKLSALLHRVTQQRLHAPAASGGRKGKRERKWELRPI